MIAVGIILAAVAIGDIIGGGLASEPKSAKRSLAGAISATTIAAIGVPVLRLDTSVFPILLLVSAYSATWLLLRTSKSTSPQRAWFSLAAHGFFLLVTLSWAAKIKTVDLPFGAWLTKLPYPGMSGVQPEEAKEVILLLGVFFWLVQLQTELFVLY